MKARFFGLMLCVSIVQSPAIAQPVEAMETCKQYSLFAKSIMESRQNGASMSRLMEVVNRDDDHSEEVKQVVIRAFEESMYASDRNKNRKIIQFENDHYLRCIKTLKAK